MGTSAPEPVQPDQFDRWLDDARQGSGDARGQLLDSCRGYLLWLANHQLAADVKAKAGASDMVQQTFLRAEQGFDGFRGQTEDELRAWLRKILLHVVANFHRDYRETGKRQVGREVPLGPTGSRSAASYRAPDRTPSSILRGDEDEATLRRAVEHLPPDYRQVIMLRYWSRLPFAAIGDIMQRSEDAARKLWARALERLESDLEANDDATG